MKLTGKANFISQRTVQGAKATYFYAKFDDGTSELEVSMDKPISDLQRFQEVTLEVDVIQGKYPKYVLKGYKRA